MKNSPKNTAYYHLPGLFEFYELYKAFLPLLFKHREYFYEWCEIGSIYGAPADCIWGGGVHMGETAEEAVKREVFEETGVPYEIDRLAVIHENFFNENSGTLKGLDCHEISFYFLIKPRGTQELNSQSFTHGAREEMHWIPIEELHKYKAFPSFMKDYLTSEHSGIEHIITDERV